MNMQLPDLLTPDQAARYLQVDRETIYRYIRDGRLGASRIGRSYRISRQSIDQLLMSNRTRPDITIRTYSDQQLIDFLEADRLDADTRKVIRSFRDREPTASTDE
jgi:excisionase family DNA binding protein